MEVEQFVLLLLLLSGAIIATMLKKTPRRRRWWVHPIYKNRIQQGDYHNLMAEMRLYDEDMFFHYTRLTIKQFEDLVAIVGPHILKKSNRQPLNPEHRLAITLRFLATGCSLQSLAFQFRIGKSTACKVVHETAKAIWNSLHEKVFVKPSKDNWLKIAKDFKEIWNLPHCIGALDGKHIRIQAPSNSGSEYYNYKQYFSVILMAMCDANYKFTYIDIGAVGSESDSGVFNRTTFAKLLESNALNLPSAKKINNSSTYEFPYFLVADEAFPLKENIMRPYPGKSLTHRQSIFNYRLSRARRIIENTFGILVTRWRIFQGPIIGKVENIEKYVQAAVCLHNYITIWNERKLTSTNKYCPPNYVDRECDNGVQLGEWREYSYNSELMRPLRRLGSNNAKKSVLTFRDELAAYLESPEGKVPWQESYVTRGTKRKRTT